MSLSEFFSCLCINDVDINKLIKYINHTYSHWDWAKVVVKWWSGEVLFVYTILLSYYTVIL